MSDDDKPFVLSRMDKLQRAAECFDKAGVAKQKGRHESAKAWKTAGEAWTEDAGDSDGE